MATEVERLLLRLEVTQRAFEKQMAAAYQSADRSSRAMEGRFAVASRNMERSFQRLGSVSTSVFHGIGRAAALAAGALGVREITQYADAWTSAGNKLRAASVISGRQARSLSDLNDLAAETRSGITETVALYSKLLLATAGVAESEEEVARATEIINKSFKAGGAAASEQAAGILQLGQALSSGLLQGDELRSLREGAPLIAKAIADEFNTTIGGLKELGTEGELTADRVFKAILNAQGEIEAAFATTVPTINEGFTLLRNGFTELIGKFNEGSGAAGGFAVSLSDLGTYLSDSAEGARRFGAQAAEAFLIMRENVDRVSGAFEDMGVSADVSAADIGAFIEKIISGLEIVVSEAAGVGASVGVGILAVVDTVASGAITIANKAIGVIESILQAVIDGVNKLVNSVNTLVGKANGITGLDIPGLNPLKAAKLNTIPVPEKTTAEPGASYRETRDATRAVLEGYFEERRGRVRRILNAGDGTTRIDIPLTPSGDDSGGRRAGSGGSGSGGSGSKAKGRAERKTLEPFFQDTERDILALERQIDAIGRTKDQIAELTAKHQLLDEAKKRGLDLDARQATSGQTLRAEIDQQAAAIGRLTAEYELASERAEFFDGIQGSLKDGLLDAIVAGESFAGVLADVAKQLAKAALQAALFNEGPFAGGGGSGPLGGLFQGLLGGFGGGRAAGGPVSPGKWYAVGERGPEAFVPRTVGTIVPNGAMADRPVPPPVININVSGARGNSEISQMVVAGLRQYDRSLPSRVARIRQDPHIRG